MKNLLFIIVLISEFCYSQNIKRYKNGDIELFYEEHGKGPALYILTGGPGAPPNDPSNLIIDSLKTFYTCVVLHQRGAGKSRNIPINSQTINIKSYLQDIELLRQQRKDKKVILVGISWGGLLAMNYTTLYPQHVSKLILICSAPPSYKVWNVLADNQFVRRSVNEIDSMNALVRIFSSKTDRELDSLKYVEPSSKEVIAFKKFITMHVRSMFYDKSKLPADFDSMFIKFNFQPIPYIDNEVLETKWDITEALKKLNVPALIMYGRQDDQGESTFFLQKECLRNSKMEVIEKCGHYIWEDQRAEFYKILMNYLGDRKK